MDLSPLIPELVLHSCSPSPVPPAMLSDDEQWLSADDGWTVPEGITFPPWLAFASDGLLPHFPTHLAKPNNTEINSFLPPGQTHPPPLVETGKQIACQNCAIRRKKSDESSKFRHPWPNLRRIHFWPPFCNHPVLRHCYHVPSFLDFSGSSFF